MYNVGRNNFYDNQKNATIYTPAPVATFLNDLLRHNISVDKVVLDPCLGAWCVVMAIQEKWLQNHRH